MRFSIIVPVYNVEKYLAKCIESILNQTNQDFELLLVNDGTKDNSQKIIDEYVAKYPDKVYGFVKENGGLSDARNYGVERAKGEYIIFPDSSTSTKLYPTTSTPAFFSIASLTFSNNSSST